MLLRLIVALVIINNLVRLELQRNLHKFVMVYVFVPDPAYSTVYDYCISIFSTITKIVQGENGVQ